MQPRNRPVSRQANATWLFAFGLFAMAMTAIGGTGLMRTHGVDGGFFVEICSVKGASRIEFVLPSGESSTPAGSHSDCCLLCATSASLLLSGTTLGVPPAPAFGRARFASPVSRSAAVARLSHSPRGPPSA